MPFFFAQCSLWAVGHFLFGFFSFVTGSVWSLILGGFFMSDAFFTLLSWEGHFFSSFFFSSLVYLLPFSLPTHDQEVAGGKIDAGVDSVPGGGSDMRERSAT